MGLKWKIIFIVIQLIVRSLMYHQDDYNIVHDRIETIWSNKSIFEFSEAKFFRYNRSTLGKALNISVKLKVDMPNKIMYHLQAFKFSSNEYRLFPIDFSLDLCKTLRQDTFGIVPSLRKHSNIQGCPFKKGIHYYVTNYIMDISHWPPHIPRGMYKTDVFVYINDNVGVGKYSYYGKVEDIIRW